MVHKEIEINNQKISYYDSEGKGHPVLFVHANSMSGLAFQKQFTSALGEKYRLVALDLPGHGKSAPALDPKATYPLPGFAAIVADFVAALGITNALLVGWSLGGHVVLEVSGHLPDSVGLMICGTAPTAKPMAPDAYIPYDLMPLLFKNALTHEEKIALTGAFFKPGFHIPEFFYDDVQRTDGKTREEMALSLFAGNYADEVVIVANLNKPLAIVHCENDPVVNLEYLKNLHAPTLWRNDIQIIPNAGHTPHWEQYEIFNSMLIQFIADL
jgi:pimeloyl-ACP methyl ester carboxylesterase